MQELQASLDVHTQRWLDAVDALRPGAVVLLTCLDTAQIVAVLEQHVTLLNIPLFTTHDDTLVVEKTLLLTKVLREYKALARMQSRDDLNFVLCGDIAKTVAGEWPLRHKILVSHLCELNHRCIWEAACG